ncbi:MAG: UvrB/UvrC motif-containing protein [Spirochaetia bacterium]|jgi:protein arginine kinase activator
MTCEICCIRDAVFHIKQIVGKEEIELHLCQSCAAVRGINTINENEDFSIGELLNNLMDIKSGLKKGPAKTVCPKCKFTFDKFKKTGRLGCSECFTVFSKQIRVLMHKMFGSISHKGKYPLKLQAYKMYVDDIQSLKIKLDEALEREDYEEAAVLRDKIKVMQEKVGGR